MNNFIKFLILFSFSCTAYSVEYMRSGSGGNGLFYSTPLAACNSSTDVRATNPYSISVSPPYVSTGNGQVVGYCYRSSGLSVSLYGRGSCVSPSTLDPVTKVCTPSTNPCTDKKNTPVTWIIKYTQEQFQKAIGGGGSTPNQWIDSGGCKAEISTKFCGADADGQGACMGVAVFNGEQWPSDAVGEHTDCTGKPDCPAPKVEFDASNDKSCTAITYTGNGASQYQCVTEAIAENPGAVKCGQVTTSSGTQWVCTAPKPTPTSEKSKVTETVKTTPNADGSTDKETTTVTEKTTCKAGVCNTTTTTNVTHNGTNADGSAKPPTESCTGPGCADEQTKDELEKEEESESSASGIGCAESLACEGDAISCALLRSQKEEKCNAEDAGDYPGKKSDIDSLFSGPEFQAPDDSEINLAGIFNTGTRFLPSACPVPMPINIASFHRTVTISFAPLCTLAEVLSYLIVAMAGLFFIRYVGEGQ